MSFFNLDIRYEPDFIRQLPEIYNLFWSKFKERNKEDVYHHHFKSTFGFNSDKGQCYEVIYDFYFPSTNKSLYSKYDTNVFMECHLNKDGTITVDNFSGL